MLTLELRRFVRDTKLKAIPSYKYYPTLKEEGWKKAELTAADTTDQRHTHSTSAPYTDPLLTFAGPGRESIWRPICALWLHMPEL